MLNILKKKNVNHVCAVIIIIYYFLLINRFYFYIDVFTAIKIYLILVIFYFLIVTYCLFYAKYLAIHRVYSYFISLMYPILLLTILLQYISVYNKYNFYFGMEFLSNINNFYYKNFILEFNNINVVFSTVTIQIFIFSLIFSYYYNLSNIYNTRFFILLNYFVFSMFFLLHGGSFIMLFLFWELIGFFSFSLIIFNNNKSNTLKSAFKAMFFNKISDLFFIISISIYFLIVNNFSIDNNSLLIFKLNSICISTPVITFNSVEAFIITLSICCFIKSAQIFFHFWLPDSMEAPLPASALIHSATLVASGIYLFIKFQIIIVTSDFLVFFFIVINTLTFCFGSLVSSVQSDYKKILAYSTIANCGVMFLSIFIIDINIVLIYFSIHGFYKSISFLISGYLISYINHNQDIRYSTNNSVVIVLFISLILVTIISLSSWFFIYSSIIKHSISSYNTQIILFKLLIMLGTIFSYLYSFRFIFIFLDKILKFFKKNTFDFKYKYIFLVYVYILLIYIFNYFNFFNNEKHISNSMFNTNILFLFYNSIFIYFFFFKNFNFFFLKKINIILVFILILF